MLMSRPYDEYENERPVQVVKKRGVLGKILFFFLGLILGMVLIAGSVFGVGYYVFTRPSKDTIELADKYVDGDLYGLIFGSVKEEDDKTIIQTGLLSERYAEKTISDLLGDSIGAITALTSNGTLSTLNDISPAVGKTLENLLKKTDELAIPLSKDTLLSKPISELSTYVLDSAKEAPLGDLLKGLGEEPSPVLMAICYGEEGVDYTQDSNGKVTMLQGEKTRLKDLMSGDMNAILNRVPVATVVDVDPEDRIMCTMAYGSSNRYTIVNGKVQMNQVAYTYKDNGDGAKLYNDKDEALALVEAPTTVTDGEETLTIKIVFLTGNTDTEGKPVSETQYLQYDKNGNLLAFEDQACQSPILYKKTLIGDLQGNSMEIIDNVRLADALDLQPGVSHKILLSLAYGQEGVDYEIVDGKVQMKESAKERTIGQLRTKNTELINEIQLCDIMTENQNDKLVMFLLYGRENVHYQIKNGVVEMQQKFVAIREIEGAIKVYNEYGETLTAQDVENNVKGYVLDTQAKTYTDGDGMTYTYEIDPTSRTIDTEDDGKAYVCYLSKDGKAVNFAKTSLGDMAGSDNIISNLTKRIKIGEIMSEDDLAENKFLKHVKDETVETLPSALNELTIQQVYAEDIYEEDGSLKGTWWYLLTIDGVEHEYKITDMASLIDNMQANIHDATLQKLSDDDIIQFSGATLTADITTQIRFGSGPNEYYEVHVYTEDTNGDGQIDHNDEGKAVSETFVNADGSPKTKVGQLTVEQMIYYVDGLLVVIDMLG